MAEFDLDCLDENLAAQNEGIDVPIYKPGTRDVIFTIGVMGPDSDQQKRAAQRGSEEAQARGALDVLTDDEVATVNARYLARCCFRWTVKDKAGKPVPFTEAAAADLIGKYAVVREVVNAAAGARGRFTKRSQTASAAP